MTTLARLDERRLTYRFDLEADVPWARAQEPGLFFPDRLLSRLGFDVDALRAVPAARASLDVLLAIATAELFCHLERDVVTFVEHEGRRHPSVSAALLVSEEKKHIALFERLAQILKGAHPTEARALPALAPPTFEHLRARAADYASADELAFSFWLHTLFFEEYTIFLQHELERAGAGAIQPLWLAAHRVHRQEEQQHVLTDAAYLEALPLDHDARRRMSKALWLFLDEHFDALFGADACARAMGSLYPEIAARPPRRLSTLPLVDDVLLHECFRRTRAAAPFVAELNTPARSLPTAGAVLDARLDARLDGGPPAMTLAPDDSITARLRAREHSDARLTFIEADGAERSFTNAALLSEARAHLAALCARGARPGDTVVLLTVAPSATVPWLWACLLGGLRAAPLALPAADPDSEESRRLLRIARLLADAERAPFVIVDDVVAPLVEAALGADPIAARAHVLSSSSRGPLSEAREHTPRADDVAIVQFSSGSLGDPRGVLLTHENLLANTTAMLAMRGGKTRETFVSWLPLFHDMGLIGYHLTPLVADAHQVLMPPLRFVKEPLSWLQALSQHHATVTGTPHFAITRLVPLLTHDVVQHLDLRSLHTFLVGAEPLSMRTLEAFAAALRPAGLVRTAMCPAYGLAEATLAVTMAPRDTGPRALCLSRASVDDAGGVRDAAPDAPDALALVDCGAAIPGVRIRIVDERGAPRPERSVGTIVVGGPTVSRGYHGEPTDDGEDHWLDTGDLGLILDGRLYVTGRKKDVFFVAGRNHYANDVEAVVRELSFVHGGAVALAVEWDPGFGVDALALFVALRADALAHEALSVDDALVRVHGHVQARMGLALDRVVAIDRRDVPRTSSGKLKRRVLLDRLRAGAFVDTPTFLRASSRATPAHVSLRPRPVIGSIGSTAPTASAAPTAVPDEPSDDVLFAVQEAWAAVLEIDVVRVTPTASFLALGGDSFRAIAVHDRLERRFDTPFPPEMLVVGSTPREMARFARGVLDRVTTKRAPPFARTTHDARAPSPRRPSAGADVADVADVAVVACALRAPGASTPAELWRMLVDGRCAIGQPPLWRREALTRALGHSDVAPVGAWLDGFDHFDPAPFSLSDDEATALGPAQRLILEVSFEALAHCALPSRRIGVFVGAGDDGTALRYVHDPSLASRHSLLGALTNMIAARAARTFGLTGPALTIDSACSSSLAAVHLACQSLRAHECDAALAGGAQVGVTSELLLSFSRAGLLSRAGWARPFDDDGEGLVPGEAVAVVVLKRLDDARRDRDCVLGVIRGSAMNNDGGALSGTAPSPAGQRDVVERAWRQAGVPPAHAALFEAHAAGTAFGDAVEARVLAEARGQGATPAAIGSIKGNLGHTLSTAGVLGLIKALLSLHHRAAPPTPGLLRPSTRVDFTAGALVPVAGAARALPTQSAPLFAGVSAFGLGGTNVHVVIEADARTVARTSTSDDGADPVVIALCTSTGGLDLCRATRRALTETNASLADIAAAANGYAELLLERRALVVTSRVEAVQGVLAFERAIEGGDGDVRGPARGRVAFVLPGPGSQLPGMGRALVDAEPVCAAALDECARIAMRAGIDLPTVLFADEDGPDARIHRLAFAQPAVFAYGYCLSRLWLHRGVRPAFVIGHSAGEYLAAHLAGMLSLDDALTLVIARGRAMATAAPGRMAAVLAEPARVEEVLARASGLSGVALAAHNAPAQVVVSGTEADVARAVEAFEGAGITVRLLDVDCAAHTSALDAAAEEFLRTLDAAAFHDAHGGITLVSTVAGEVGAPLDAQGARAHFGWHLTARVDFVSAIAHAHGLGADVFLELGATAGLSTCVRQILDDAHVEGEDAPLVVACGARGEPERHTLAHATAALIDAGLPVKTSTLGPRPTTAPADLLPFPWRRRRLWVEPRPSTRAPGPLLKDEPCVRDHVTAGRPSAPAALLVDRALEVLCRAHGPVELYEIIVERPLWAEPHGARSLVIAAGDRPNSFVVATQGEGERTVHVSGRYARARGRTHAQLDLDALRARLTRAASREQVYARLDRTGFSMGPAMRAVERVFIGDRELLAELRTPSGSTEGAFIDPSLLDGASHAVAAWFLDARLADARMYLGFAIDALRVHAPVRGGCLAYVRARGEVGADVPALRYDVTLVDAQGQVQAEVEDFAARRVDSVAAAPALSTTPAPASTIPPEHAAVRATDGGSARTVLLELLRGWIGERLRRDPKKIGEHTALARLGVDSLMAVELVRRLEAHLGMKLHATLLFEAPTLAAVVDRVMVLARERGVSLPTSAGGSR